MTPQALRILIVDDEPLARARLATLVAEVQDPPCTVVASCDGSEAARAEVARGHVDCVLLDIQMPGVDGLQLAQDWLMAGHGMPAGSASRPAIIFVTAFADHALRAFDLEALDYLTKPVRRERLQAALQRVVRRRPATVAPREAPVLVASERGRVARIPVHEVLYLKAELKYVTLRTADRSWVLDESLTELESRLGDMSTFIRIHRNALVAKHAVAALNKHAEAVSSDGEAVWAVHVRHVDEWLAVSRRQLPSVREALQQAL
jgi:two-component system, LytTR family, response regulator AlgR